MNLQAQLGLPYRQQFTIDVTKGSFALTKDNFRFEENPAGVKITSVQKSTISETYWVSFSVNSGARGNLKFWLADNDANYVPITFNGTTGKVATMEVYEEEPMSDGIPQRPEQSPSSAEIKQAKYAGYEDGFKSAVGEKESNYRSRASAKSNELGYTSALVGDYMEGSTRQKRTATKSATTSTRS